MRRVNLIIDEEELDLKDDTIITLSRQVNNIAELVDRQADYSNQFNIPKTAKNVRLLNKNRYKKVPASIVQYGATTRGFLVIASEDTEYKCQFYAGALNFFNLIEGLKLRDLDFSDVHHTFQSIEMTASQNNNWEDGYIYPLINTAEDFSAYHPTNAGSFLPDAKIPCMFVRYILQKIVEKVQWNIDGLALRDEKFLRAVTPVQINNGDTTQLFSEVQTTPLHIAGGTPTAMTIIYPFANVDTAFNQIPDRPNYGLGTCGSNSYSAPYIMIPYSTTIQDGAIQVGTDGLAWDCGYTFPNMGGTSVNPTSTKTHIAKCDTMFDVNINLSFLPSSTTIVRAVRFPNSTATMTTLKVNCSVQSIDEIQLVAYSSAGTRSNGTPFRVIRNWQRGSSYFGNTFQLSLNGSNCVVYKNERLGLVMYCDTTQVTDFDDINNLPYAFYTDVNGIHLYESTLTISNTRLIGDKSYPVPYGGRYDLAKSMPDITIKDYMKALAQQFALIFDADETTQTLNVVSFNNIYNNIPYAYDWSDKVDARQESKKYHSDYCQLNDMKFTEDTAPKGYGDATFRIEDNSLKPRKTALQVAFASTFFTQRWSRNMLHLPVWGATYTPNAFFPNDKFKTRIFGVYFDSANFTAIAFFENIVSLPITYDYTMQNSIDRDYSALIRSLKQYEFINETIWLTAQDFLGFNHFIPVYIAKYQAYFYVNKITNFKEGVPTKVELLKLI